MAESTPAAPGYYGQPIVKAPVWTWQIGLYFFLGGMAGMSGMLAFAGLVNDAPLAFVRSALWLAVAGSVVSPVLLIWDLGRPSRFLNMLRVFKWRSPMSVGVWMLVTFSACAAAALLLLTVLTPSTTFDPPSTAARVMLLAAAAGTGLTGAGLATYVGVLLGATAVPVWSAYHRLLPFHFGIVALGSAVSALELLGFRVPALQALGLAAATIETGVGAWIELKTGGPRRIDAIRGDARLLLRAAAICTGPAALLLRVAGWLPAAAVVFLIGALLNRYGWLHAGRASAQDPEQTLYTVRRQAET
jgi:Polysulphide reductase, NrfD